MCAIHLAPTASIRHPPQPPRTAGVVANVPGADVSEEYETALDVALGLARPLSENPSRYERALHHGLLVCRNIWATTTWRSASALWKRFVLFSREMAKEPRQYTKEEVAIAFCETQSVCEATRHTYAVLLLAIFKRLGEPALKFRTYATALTADGATKSTRQAVPATRTQVTTLLMRATALELKATLFMLWKASARVSDVRSLTKESFIVERNGCRIIVTWGTTKTTRFHPDSPHAVTVLDSDRPMTILTNRLAELQQGQRFTTVTVAKMNQFLKAMLPQAHLTSHSFKRGGVMALFRRVEPGDLTVAQVQQAARHRRIESTLGYGNDPTARGPALGSQTATRLL